ncbi:Protein translocase subunit SecF [Candidatus Hepatincolaceae symbiont of Richtersius coronifer]
MTQLKLGIIGKTSFDFLKYAKVFFIFSALMMVLAISVVAFKGFNWGIDFRGGIVIDLKANKSYSLEDINNHVKALNVKDFSIKQFGDNELQIIISNASLEGASSVTNLIDNLKSQLAEDYTFRQSQFVGPSVSAELIKGGIMAVILSLIGIFIYVWFRFDWQYGLIGVVTLIWDISMGLLFLSLTYYEFSLSTIAAILTILGYSINDTVVIFDQIREDVRKYSKNTVKSIINLSINQVLSRSLSTSITLLLVLGSIFVFGGDTLRSFSFVLFIGVLFGTYSSICVAAISLAYIGNIRPKIQKKQKDAV